MRYGILHILSVAVGALLAILPESPALGADKARASGLTDANFGFLISTSDQSLSQNICAYSSSATKGYSVVALGTGPGGAFELSSGSAQMQYEVLWADGANQVGGRSLASGVSENGFTSSATQQFCNSGPIASASLTIVIRSLALESARAGSYSGTLQITLAPE